MKLYVPDIGDQIQLEADWKFNLYNEHRNDTLLLHFTGKKHVWNRDDWNKPPSFTVVTLPAGTILKVDRIYIRNGAESFSSLTFRVVNGKAAKCRFWAKLPDCNNIEFVQTDPAPRRKTKVVFDDGIPRYPYALYYTGDREEEVTRTNYVYLEDVLDQTREKVFRVEHTFRVKGYSHREHLSFGNPVFRSDSSTLKYKLLDLEGKELGSWKSFASLSKKVKELAADRSKR